MVDTSLSSVELFIVSKYNKNNKLEVIIKMVRYMIFKGFPYYLGAIATTKCIRAILFVFVPGKNGDKVTLDTCTGWVRHMGRFYESRTYSFLLDTQLSKGNIEVLLLDKKKHPILKLNEHSPSGTIALDGKSRYYLRWEFRSASGKCKLQW